MRKIQSSVIVAVTVIVAVLISICFLATGRNKLVMFDLSIAATVICIVLPLFISLILGKIKIAELGLSIMTYSLLGFYAIYPVFLTLPAGKRFLAIVVLTIAVASVKLFFMKMNFISQQWNFALSSTICLSLIGVEQILMQDNTFTLALKELHNSCVASQLFNAINHYFGMIKAPDRIAISSALIAMVIVDFELIETIQNKEEKLCHNLSSS